MRSKPVLIVHGIATDGGSLYLFGERLGRLGYDVRYYHYEKRHFWSYWRKSSLLQDGGSLLHFKEYEEGMDVVAHSNGQLVVQSAVDQGAKFGRVVIFSGAGTSDKFAWPAGSMEQCHWFVNTKDKAVWWGALLPNHVFGKAGRIGYAGVHDLRHKNHKYIYGKLFNINHSFWFSEWSDKMISIVHGLFSKP